MQLTDTHCHIHEAGSSLASNDPTRAMWLRAGCDPDQMIKGAAEQSVTKLICVGTSLEDSKLATEFVQKRPNCWASIGIHPHEAKLYNKKRLDDFAKLIARPKVVAIGECGLDYYYNHSPKEAQRKIFEFQLDLAQKQHMPLIFHVREAFDDFFAVLSHFEGVRGVVHSFTANTQVLDKILNRGLYIGLNGIMTFTRDEAQIKAARAVPLQKILLETDAPFLTPKPYRGTICLPEHLSATAEFLSDLRNESIEELAEATTRNAQELFDLK